MNSNQLDIEFARLRKEMVERQIVGRGIRNPRVIDAMKTVPRHRFVPAAHASRAYGDYPLSIGEGQTISQPYMVAYMIERVQPEPEDVVLEVGSGCGYAVAVLAQIVQKVYGIEYIPELAAKATRNLQELGYKNFEIGAFDGSKGWPEKSPFDGIVVSAGAPAIPQDLKKQLAPGGIMVIPTGDRFSQRLEIVKNHGDKITVTPDLLCRFVDLRGKEGWGA